MTKVFVFFISMLLLPAINYAQNSNDNQLALKFAKRMKDSLSLNPIQRVNILQINLALSQEKRLARQQYNGNDSLKFIVRGIELKRDSLYQTVLPAGKYTQYLDKKMNIINNN